MWEGDGDGENVGAAVGACVPASYANMPIGLVPDIPATITVAWTAAAGVPTGLPHVRDVSVTHDVVKHSEGISNVVGDVEARPKPAPLMVNVAPPKTGKLDASA